MMLRGSGLALVWGIGVAVIPAAAQRIKLSASLGELESRARVDSNDAAAHYNLASALVAARRYEDAQRSLREAVVRLDPQYAPALLLLADVNDRTANGPFVALASGRQIFFLRLDPKASETALLRRRAFLIDPLLEIGPPSRDWLPTQWRLTLGQALRAYDVEKWQEAIAGFQTVIDRTVRPNDSTRVPPVALWFRARCALRVGDYDGAIRHLEWLLALRLRDTTVQSLVWNPFAGDELRYVLAYVHQQAGRWDAAIERYQELAVRNLGLDGAHSHMAEIYEAQGRWTDAVEERVRAYQANPDATSLVFNLGATLTSAGRHEEAVAMLERYLTAYPRESRAYYLLGVARMSLGKPAEAREALTRYLALAPSRYVDQIADARQRLATLQP
jgi:tetratricopeptide (TPR) repeat protein